MKRLIILVFALAVFIPGYSQGYKIQVKIDGLSNADLILGYHKDQSLIPYDTVKTDAKGNAVFKGDKKLTKGMYFVFLPNRTYFDFIVGDDQNFSIETDTTDLVKHLKIKGSPDNDLLKEYEKYMDEQSTKAKELQDKIKSAKNDKEKKKYIKQLENLKKQWEDYTRKLAGEHPDLFASKFLLATLEPEVPDTIKDPLEKYIYLKEHYFDNFDFTDISMLYTPIYGNKIDTYLDRYILQHPDSLNAAVDYLLDKTKNNDELYRYMLIHLFNKYARSKLMIAENVYVHLADIYIKTATWDNSDFKKRLKTKIARKKNCLIGNKALDLDIALLPQDSADIELLRDPLKQMKQQGLKIEKEKPDFDSRVPELSQLIADYMGNFPDYINLYDIKADYIVLWFWDPECSHCKKETPELYKAWNDELKDLGVKVVAVYLARNTDDWNHFCNHIGKWYTFVEKNHMYGDGWYNGWNPFANSRFKYDINATPKVFLLDKDKKIIAKQIGVDDIKTIVEGMEKEKQKEKKK